MADISDLQDGTSGKDKLVEGEDVQQTGSTEVAEGGAAEESQTEPVLEPEAGSDAILGLASPLSLTWMKSKSTTVPSADTLST